MKRLIPIIVIVVLLAGGWYGYDRYQRQQQSRQLGNLQTEPVSRGNLVATVGATGVVRSNQTAMLAWQTSGVIKSVYVKAGDFVEADQLLAELEPTSVSQNIILAQVELVSARKALEDLYDTQLALAQAEQKLANLKDLLEDQEYRLESLQQPATPLDIQAAEAQVLIAKAYLDRTWERYKPYANKSPNNLMRATLYQKLVEAQKKYDAAVRKLNSLQGPASDLTIEIADKTLQETKLQLAEAQKTVDELRTGPSADDITAAKARVSAAEATLNLMVLKAPFAGTITDMKVKARDQVNPGTIAFRLDDLSHLLVDVQVSEVDINRVRVGQPASLTFDAILNKEYEGVISQVSRVGTSTQGVVDFTVTVELTNADESVKPGMTAAVNIVVSELQNVLRVPNRAVRVENGQRVVYVLKDGKQTTVRIKLGASSETHSEVVEGELQEGDLIILNPPTVYDQSGPPPFVRNQ